MTDKIFSFASKGKRGAITVEILEIYQYLNTLGYKKRTFQDEKEIFKIEGKFIYPAFIVEFQNHIIQYLNDNTEAIQYRLKINGQKILEEITKYGWKKIFRPENWVYLNELDVDLIKHTKNKAIFFFSNGFVEVCKDGIELKNYEELKGHIYAHSVIDKEIKLIEDVFNPINETLYKKGWKFLDYLQKVSQQQRRDKSGKAFSELNTDKLTYLLQLIGYLCHFHKQKGVTDFAPYFCDDEAGGSGKGILIDAIGLLIGNSRVCRIDARNSDKGFDIKDLTEHTKVKVYNDVEPNFPFQIAMNDITETTTVRHLHKDTITVPWEESWKVCFTANFLIKLNMSADKRRVKIFDFYPHFSNEHTPFDEYGHFFYSEDWSKEDWNFFYNIMLSAASIWLQAGRKELLQYNDENLNERIFEHHYPLEFRTYMDKIPKDKFISTRSLYDQFIEENKHSPFIRKMTSNKFGRLLSAYLKDCRIEFHKNSNNTQIFIVKSTK